MNVLNSIISNRQVNNNKYNNKSDKKKIKAASIAGSAIGIAAGVAGVYAMAKKGNPSLKLRNLAYEEKDVLLVGLGSITGGLVGGLLANKEKKNVKPKLREASQQFIGNMVFPIGLLAAGNRILDKSGFKLPKINSDTKFAKTMNGVLSVLPKITVTLCALFGGMELGNKFMNKVNNEVFDEEVKHEVEAEDYLVHADDLCLAANMLLKDAASVSAVTSKILPLTFIVAGSKTGMTEVENKK